MWLCNQQLPQSALGSKTPFGGDEGLAQLNPALFKKSPTTFRGVTTGDDGRFPPPSSEAKHLIQSMNQANMT
jgi:hypothetical protein